MLSIKKKPAIKFQFFTGKSAGEVNQKMMPILGKRVFSEILPICYWRNHFKNKN